jgi:drug/metabolite transporter (DMT)-like permease
LSKKLLAHIALFLVALIYGANYSIAKIVMDEESFSPFALLGFRLLTGFVVFTLFYFGVSREKIDRSVIGLIVLCGLTGTGLNMALFLYGLNHTNPINASLVMTTAPVLVLVFSWILLKQKISILSTVGIFIALAGAIYLVYRPGFGFSLGKIKGDLSIFLNGACYAMYLVLVKRLIAKYSPVTILMLVFSVGLLFIFPFTIIDITRIEWQGFSSSIYYSLAFVLIGTTCLTYLFNVFALQYVKSSLAGVYIYLQPVMASFFAILIFGEMITWRIILSSILIFAGLYLVSIKK